MLSKLKQLILVYDPVHLEQFKIQFIRWTSEILQVLSEADHHPAFRDKVDLEHPIESLYHIAFNVNRKGRSISTTDHGGNSNNGVGSGSGGGGGGEGGEGGDEGDRGRGHQGLHFEDQRQHRLRDRVDQLESELASQRHQKELLEITCREDVRRAKEASDALETCQRELRHLQGQYEQLGQAKEHLQTELIQTRAASERNQFFMLALTQHPHPLTSYTPSDTCLKMDQDVAMRADILNTAMTSHTNTLLKVVPATQDGLVVSEQQSSPPSNPLSLSCSSCDQRQETYEHEVERFTHALIDLQQRNRSLEGITEILQAQIKTRSQVDRGYKLTQYVFTQKIQNINMSYYQEMTHLQNKLKQVIHERNKLLQEKPIVPDDFDSERLLLIKQYARLHEAVGTYLRESESEKDTSLREVYQEVMQMEAEEPYSKETISDLKARNAFLECQLMTMTQKLESENVQFSNEVLPLVKTVFQTSDLHTLKKHLEIIETVWGESLLILLEMLKERRINQTTLPRLTDLLLAIEEFTSISDLHGQFEYMNMILKTVLPVCGGLEFLHLIRHHTPLIKSPRAFLSFLTNLFSIETEYPMGLDAIYAFVKEVYRTVKPLKEGSNVADVRVKYLQAEYMSILLVLTGDTSLIDLDELVRGYVLTRKRPKHT